MLLSPVSWLTVIFFFALSFSCQLTEKQQVMSLRLSIVFYIVWLADHEKWTIFCEIIGQ